MSKTYGTISSDRQRKMGGLEFIQGLVNGTLPLNTMAETLGYDVTEVVKGRASAYSPAPGAMGMCVTRHLLPGPVARRRSTRRPPRRPRPTLPRSS